MARDGRLVDEHQVELAQHLCRQAITYTERQLGLSTLRPPREPPSCAACRPYTRQLEQLEGAIGALRAGQD